MWKRNASYKVHIFYLFHSLAQLCCGHLASQLPLDWTSRLPFGLWMEYLARMRPVFVQILENFHGRKNENKNVVCNVWLYLRFSYCSGQPFHITKSISDDTLTFHSTGVLCSVICVFHMYILRNNFWVSRYDPSF